MKHERYAYLGPFGVSFLETAEFPPPACAGSAQYVANVRDLVVYAMHVLHVQMGGDYAAQPPIQKELAARMGARQSQISRWANGANLRLPPGHPGWKVLCDLIMSQAAVTLGG